MPVSSERRRARAGVMPRIAFLVCMKQNMISVACSFFTALEFYRDWISLSECFQQVLF